MPTALATQAEPILRDVNALLREIEALRDPQDWVTARADDLRSRLAALALSSDDRLSHELGDLVLLLGHPVPEGAEGRGVWGAYRKRLQMAYDGLIGTMKREAIELPVFRPNNYRRNLMHVTTALICLLLVEHVLSPVGMIITAAIGAVVCWSLETGRIFSDRLNQWLLKSMAAVAHPHERRHVNSATWYTTALLILALLFTPKVCAVALAVLGLADPAAGLVGRRWGRIEILNGRSLEGTATFLVVGTLSALLALSIWHPEVEVGFALLIAVGATLPAAITELLSRRVDDNFSIPIAAATGAWVVSLIV